MKKNSNENLYFASSELSLVAYLRTVGYQIINTENRGRQVIFYIKKDCELEKHINAFWSHTARTSPLAYFNSLKETKSFIYQR